jgi:hypothetical protein
VRSSITVTDVSALPPVRDGELTPEQRGRLAALLIDVDTARSTRRSLESPPHGGFRAVVTAWASVRGSRRLGLSDPTHRTRAAAKTPPVAVQ